MISRETKARVARVGFSFLRADCSQEELDFFPFPCCSRLSYFLVNGETRKRVPGRWEGSRKKSLSCEIQFQAGASGTDATVGSGEISIPAKGESAIALRRWAAMGREGKASNLETEERKKDREKEREREKVVDEGKSNTGLGGEKKRKKEEEEKKKETRGISGQTRAMRGRVCIVVRSY